MSYLCADVRGSREHKGLALSLVLQLGLSWDTYRPLYEQHFEKHDKHDPTVFDIIGTGSFYEGLYLPTFINKDHGKTAPMDHDTMAVFKQIDMYQIDEERDDLRNITFIKMEKTKHSIFYKMKVCNVKLLQESHPKICNFFQTFTNPCGYLSSKMVANSGLSARVPGWKSDVHGPALQIQTHKTKNKGYMEKDYVLALHSPQWPSSAHLQWSHRVRTAQWPPSAVVDRVVKLKRMLNGGYHFQSQS